MKILKKLVTLMLNVSMLCGILPSVAMATYNVQVNGSGIDTMVNYLGIKTEIDIKLENEMPLEYTESVLDKEKTMLENL